MCAAKQYIIIHPIWFRALTTNYSLIGHSLSTMEDNVKTTLAQSEICILKKIQFKKYVLFTKNEQTKKVVAMLQMKDMPTNAVNMPYCWHT